MTANELNLLIDILERRGEDRQLEAATMLRQQQARIEQLEPALGRALDLVEAYRKPMRELTDEEIYDCFKIPKDKRNTAQSDYNIFGCREVADAILKKASDK